MNIHDKLRRPFPVGSVHWRAQPFKRGATQGFALAYVDARDVQKRLDDVVGPFGWQTYIDETSSGRVLCRLSLLNPETGEWITKTDGAGATDIEGAKGGISDAFKRVAVAYGIGRYLYSLPDVFVDLENGRLPRNFQPPVLPAWATPEGFDEIMRKKEETE